MQEGAIHSRSMNQEGHAYPFGASTPNSILQLHKNRDKTMVDVLYTVQPSDENGGLLAIASRLYGDSSRWTDIYEANQSIIGNNPNVIHKGQQLIIPALDERGAGNGRMRVYIVQHGDLRDGMKGIARLLYGDEARWQEIYAINYGVVGNDPSLLQAGQILIVPW